jgi:hypothetical protein
MIPGGAIYEDDLLYAGHVGAQELLCVHGYAPI